MEYYDEQDKVILDEVTEIAENLDFSVQISNNRDKEYSILFSKFSSAGQDFNISVIVSSPLDTIHDVWEKVDDYYDDYDVSYEAYLWLDSDGHGTNGAPYEMIDVYNDMKECEGFIRELADALY